jgi:small-conductance mechanosensitive channel
MSRPVPGGHACLRERWMPQSGDQTMKQIVKTSDELNPQKQRDIQAALQQMKPARRLFEVPTLRRSWRSTLVYVVLFVALGGAYYLSHSRIFATGRTYEAYSERLLLGGLLIIALIAAERLIRIFLIGKLSDEVVQYTVAKLLRFAIWLIIVAVSLSALLSNWTTALVSLGLISLVLGLALQGPLTNLFSWFYILIRAPYRIGDRIKLAGASGDVISVGFFDTTLWEFGGEYVTTDHPSGRIIKFPNSLVLSTAVYNYSWPLFPFIWNEIRFYVAYQSDLDFIASTMRAVAAAEIGDEMREHVATYRALLAKTLVDEIEVTDDPLVLFRAGDNGHIEAIVRYLVLPKQAGQIKTALIRKMLEKLNEEPKRVLFPTA